MKIVVSTKWLRRLDSLTHWLNRNLGVPVVRPICDAYENRLQESFASNSFGYSWWTGDITSSSSSAPSVTVKWDVRGTHGG